MPSRHFDIRYTQFRMSSLVLLHNLYQVQLCMNLRLRGGYKWEWGDLKKDRVERAEGTFIYPLLYLEALLVPSYIDTYTYGYFLSLSFLKVRFNISSENLYPQKKSFHAL